ncbi:fatty acid desaturase, putative [Pediculus humanus corporis]|uniref:Fatty acid desaturase, putative n=1 Tax=Pediculus humanus subsp. corporis TaxID=121224 RepID=E0VE42_PEDHC|nr:fatty acid desaturase, putative [Pediculus humanus corporis]EEB11648.1 fatty acid desaturase, putative [Pediculus humanus corporis]
MAPNLVSVVPTGTIFENELPTGKKEKVEEEIVNGKSSHKAIVWRNAILFAYLHVAAVYGLYLAITSAKLYTNLWAYALYVSGGLGITAGAHRLWSHKSYKAKLPLKIFLTICNTIAFQNSIWEWARDHRVHHKFSETDADPHNAKNGFFFSHVGWLLVKKHPDVRRKGKVIDMSDLDQDPVVAFQKKYYLILMPIGCFLIPTFVPVYFWGETWSNAWFVATLFRYCFTLNATWLVNSAAHFFGSKPYDKNMNPAENLMVAVGALGEGWHNYHHVFPWDYKAAELGNYGYNFTTCFIDIMAKLGQAYDLKTVSPHIVIARAKRTGDGSYVPPENVKIIKEDGHSIDGDVWGWGDKDMKPEDIKAATIINEDKSEERCKTN